MPWLLCYVLEQVEKGEEVDFKKKFSKDEDRVLRAEFLERLLTGSLPWIKITKEGVEIRYARLRESLILKGETIPFPISLYGCIFQYITPLTSFGGAFITRHTTYSSQELTPHLLIRKTLFILNF